MHDAIMAEFGGSLVDESAGMPAGTTEDGIELHEHQTQPQDAECMDVIGESLSYLIGAT